MVAIYEHKTGVSLSLYYVLYNMLHLFDRAMGMARVQTRSQYYNCMRENYYSHDRSESIGVERWETTGGKENPLILNL